MNKALPVFNSIRISSTAVFLIFTAPAYGNDFRKLDDGVEDEIIAQVTRQAQSCHQGTLAIEADGIKNRTAEHWDKAEFTEDLRKSLTTAGVVVHDKSSSTPADGTLNLTLNSAEKSGGSTFSKTFKWNFVVSDKIQKAKAKPCMGEGTFKKEVEAKP